MHPTPTANEYAHLMDAAKRRASHLRDQAISDLWRQARLVARKALGDAGRFARHLTHHGQPGKQQGA
ncbi:hypothetical protein [Polaromonas sp.]|uniref:hypothetical protein n=1 Tax=Polaromonas sp. TaxID=1869339 RepID=UPI00272FE4AA|nr:hypothetical protein [Polaromonas sp.]MDP1740062.1 hypothetical protein [Polaromonas sp.]